MLQKFLSSVFDEQHQFQDLWELKLVKFDTALDAETKPYQRHLATSTLVQDMKGNPGFKGNFYITNLRLVWYANNDKDINLSIGLDSINYVLLKTYPQQGAHQLKHVLLIKAMSPAQTKYEFKFAGFREEEQRIFRKVEAIFRKFTQTKYFRNIDTSPKLVNGEYRPLKNQEMKTIYNGCTFVENQTAKDAIIILTDLRLVIIHEKGGLTNYGIPWIMIQKYAASNYKSRQAVSLSIRGLLKDVELYIFCSTKAQNSKMFKQFTSFSETYNKNPTLGMDFSDLRETVDPGMDKFTKTTEIGQFEQTKVNIGRRANPYGEKNQKGALKETFFCEELGIMMQKFPQGCSRRDLWEIL